MASIIIPSRPQVAQSAIAQLPKGQTMLQDIEALGGMAGYQKWLASAPVAAPVGREPSDFPNTVACSGDAWAALVYEGIELHTGDGHSGNGRAWGFGAGYFHLVGALFYTEWSTLTSKDCDFHVVGGGVELSTVNVIFTIDGEVHAIAVMVGGGLGGMIGINGTFRWK